MVEQQRVIPCQRRTKTSIRQGRELKPLVLDIRVQDSLGVRGEYVLR